MLIVDYKNLDCLKIVDLLVVCMFLYELDELCFFCNGLVLIVDGGCYSYL